MYPVSVAQADESTGIPLDMTLAYSSYFPGNASTYMYLQMGKLKQSGKVSCLRTRASVQAQTYKLAFTMREL